MTHRWIPKTVVFWFVLVWIAGAFSPVYAGNQGNDPWTEVILPEGTSTHRDAAFFRAEGDRGVVFAPGLAFRKESWFDLAKALQSRDVASIALSDGSEENIHHAVQAFERYGFKHITLVGGSMSGGGVLLYAQEQRSVLIDQIVALAPYGGRPVSSRRIKKLFVVATQDRFKLLEHVRDLYQRSTDPRQIKIYDGEGHAQHLLDGPSGNDLLQRIIAFISDG